MVNHHLLCLRAVFWFMCIVYVYHITSETNSPDLMEFINENILKCVQKDYSRAFLNEEIFFDKNQLLQKWGICMERQTTVLYLLPHIDVKDAMDAGMRVGKMEK